MRDKIVLYICDPEKNKECKKTGCVHNKEAKDPYCSKTSRKEYSADGIPIVFDR